MRIKNKVTVLNSSFISKVNIISVGIGNVRNILAFFLFSIAFFCYSSLTSFEFETIAASLAGEVLGAWSFAVKPDSHAQ